MKFCIFVFLFLQTLFFNPKLFASCNFPTGEFIEELNDPSTIKEINITTPQSGKFYKNYLKILKSNTLVIPNNLKKNFFAKLTVKYDFGTCEFDSKIRQNGNLRDHISIDSHGNPFMSLVVKLDEGNIMNAVKFKLLIPESRNGLNEVFGTVLLRELGYISPETFEVSVSLNDIYNDMIFQEDSRKELLERNSRREGPVFEGDKSILWPSENSEIFNLEKLALGRLTNKNWFNKGRTSRDISLLAFNKIQNAYLKYSQIYQVNGNDLKDTNNLGLIFKINHDDDVFSNYFFNLIALNGWHGLRGHNRKFYFNSIKQEFEPIYYDGNLDPTSFELKKNQFNNVNLEKILITSFKYIDEFNYNSITNSLKFDNKVLENFKKRTHLESKAAEKYVEDSINRIKENEKQIQIYINQQKEKINTYNLNNEQLLTLYKSNMKNKEFKQILVTSISYNRDTDNYILKLDGENKSYINVTSEQLGDLLSNNSIFDKRAVYINKNYNESLTNNYTTTKFALKGLSIQHSHTLKIYINENLKTISLYQTDPKDWALFNNIDLLDWKIFFKGASIKNSSSKPDDQRFNLFGLTGCLNFYNTSFNNTSIEISGGQCEDSLNIINSNGKINSILISDSFSDAIDFDFSELNVSNIDIKNAGNDCLDLSYGVYEINSISTNYCKDKGISVGEKSKLKANSFKSSHTNIGVSSKDLSKTYIDKAFLINTLFCSEAIQKKQEFGGGYLKINKLYCDAQNHFDENSLIIINQL